MTYPYGLPASLYSAEGKLNLFCLHELFKHIAGLVADQLKQQRRIDVPITAGMWGGSYLIANEAGVARTNVIRLYSIVNLPQHTPLDEKENFEHLIKIYYKTFREVFKTYGLNFVDPRWGEPIPCTNKFRPTTALQMWESNKRVAFLRAFFVWNTATWEESIIYDMVRNIKQIKELLDINTRPPRKESQELKFLLQDVLIIYFTLKPALSPDFKEHAEPIITELLDKFLGGLQDDEQIEELFQKVYSNALVYGFEEAMEGPYGKGGLNIHKVEEWPVEKINWVPEELKEKLAPYLRETFLSYKNHLDNKSSMPAASVSPEKIN
ncbi:MAG: hypothetical protein V3U37_07150 [Nitrospinaceae bacterium]